jgi:hypothetical protein
MNIDQCLDAVAWLRHSSQESLGKHRSRVSSGAMPASNVRCAIVGGAMLLMNSTMAGAETVSFTCQSGDTQMRLEIDDVTGNVIRKVIQANGIPSLMSISPAKFSGDHVRWTESRAISVQFTLNLRSGTVLFMNVDSRGGIFGGQIEGCEKVPIA